VATSSRSSSAQLENKTKSSRTAVERFKNLFILLLFKLKKINYTLLQFKQDFYPGIDNFLSLKTFSEYQSIARFVSIDLFRSKVKGLVKTR